MPKSTDKVWIVTLREHGHAQNVYVLGGSRRAASRVAKEATDFDRPRVASIGPEHRWDDLDEFEQRALMQNDGVAAFEPEWVENLN